VKQGEEDEDFWKLFNCERKPRNAYDKVAEWNYWFLDVCLRFPNIIILAR